MKSKIKPVDFFCILEMIGKGRIGLIMNVLTYKKIIGKTFGDDNYEKIPNPIPMINGISITFDESKPNDNVTLITKYIPHTTESFEIEIF